jgi:hypothetical protein
LTMRRTPCSKLPAARTQWMAMGSACSATRRESSVARSRSPGSPAARRAGRGFASPARQPGSVAQTVLLRTSRPGCDAGSSVTSVAPARKRRRRRSTDCD